MGLPEPHFTTFYPFRPGFQFLTLTAGFAKFTPPFYFNFTLNFAGLLVSEPLIRPPGSKVQISIPTLTLTYHDPSICRQLEPCCSESQAGLGAPTVPGP